MLFGTFLVTTSPVGSVFARIRILLLYRFGYQVRQFGRATSMAVSTHWIATFWLDKVCIDHYNIWDGLLHRCLD